VTNSIRIRGYLYDGSPGSRSTPARLRSSGSSSMGRLVLGDTSRNGNLRTLRSPVPANCVNSPQRRPGRWCFGLFRTSLLYPSRLLTAFPNGELFSSRRCRDLEHDPYAEDRGSTPRRWRDREGRGHRPHLAAAPCPYHPQRNVRLFELLTAPLTLRSIC
jgi:hypothetical protein